MDVLDVVGPLQMRTTPVFMKLWDAYRAIVQESGAQFIERGSSSGALVHLSSSNRTAPTRSSHSAWMTRIMALDDPRCRCRRAKPPTAPGFSREELGSNGPGTTKRMCQGNHPIILCVYMCFTMNECFAQLKGTYTAERHIEPQSNPPWVGNSVGLHKLC